MILTRRATSETPRKSGFSLIEVTLSLGIVGFALVAILGALPLAMNEGRYSVEQTRASNIAETLFASFRAQPFSKVYYLSPTADSNSGGGMPVDLSRDNSAATPVTDQTRQFYATFTDGMANGSAINFESSRAGAEYGVDVGFNNVPGLASNQAASGGQGTAGTMPIAGMASQVEVVVFALDHPNDLYRFVTVIANRAQ